MNLITRKIIICLLLTSGACTQIQSQMKEQKNENIVIKTDAEWKAELPENVYSITRKMEQNRHFIMHSGTIKAMALMFVIVVDNCYSVLITNMIQDQDGRVFIRHLTNRPSLKC